MAKSQNQKIKILLLAQILQNATEENPVSMQDILTTLTEQEIRAERKSIYDDMDALRDFGIQISFRRGRNGGYYLSTEEACKLPIPEVTAESTEETIAEETEAEQKNEAPAETSSVETLPEIEAEAELAAEENTELDEPVSIFEKKKKESEEPVWEPVAENGSAKKKMKLSCSKMYEKEVRAFFGDLAQYKEKDYNVLVVSAPVMEDPKFFGWLTYMGTAVHLMKPKRVGQAYREYLKALAKEYKYM